jgi:hypothetical protein
MKKVGNIGVFSLSILDKTNGWFSPEKYAIYVESKINDIININYYSIFQFCQNELCTELNDISRDNKKLIFLKYKISHKIQKYNSKSIIIILKHLKDFK